MDLRIFMEWDSVSGIKLSDMYPLREQVESFFKEKAYGSSISKFTILLNYPINM